MTTPEDQLFDDLCDVAADYLIRKGMSSGVQKLAQLMHQAAMDEMGDKAPDPNPELARKLVSAKAALDSFDRMLSAEQLRIKLLQEG